MVSCQLVCLTCPAQPCLIFFVHVMNLVQGSSVVKHPIYRNVCCTFYITHSSSVIQLVRVEAENQTIESGREVCSNLHTKKKKKLENELVGIRNACNYYFKLSVSVPSNSFSSHKKLSETMVDSKSHTESDGCPGSPWPFVQIYPWKHQRNIQHEKGNDGQA